MKPIWKLLLTVFIGANLLVFYYNIAYLRKGAPPTQRVTKQAADEVAPAASPSPSADPNQVNHTARNLNDLRPIIIRFELSNSNLSAKSQEELLNLFNKMSENPNIKVEVGGHTDNIGDPIKNLTLSVERAKTIKDYLVKLGVAEDRIVVKGYGHTIPLVDNSSEEGRAQNRRVEVKVISS